jgi:DUF1680 family protein
VAPDQDMDLDNVRIPADIELSATYDPNFLGGVGVLEGTAVAGPTPAVQIAEPQAWNGDLLYRSLPPRRNDLTGSRPVNIRLIPYFAWNNRQKKGMKVWLPLPG